MFFQTSPECLIKTDKIMLNIMYKLFGKEITENSAVIFLIMMFVKPNA